LWRANCSAAAARRFSTSSEKAFVSRVDRRLLGPGFTAPWSPAIRPAVQEDCPMLTFIIQGHYTQEAIRGMATSPEDRTEAARTMMEKAGGRLVAFYLTFGSYDFLCVCEAPDEETMAAVAAAERASGSVVEQTITLAIPGGRMKDVLGRAGELGKSFKSAGQP
jgi:uncharacterized protein with GYD domain